jgi:hypothetical protein
LIDVASNKI